MCRVTIYYSVALRHRDNVHRPEVRLTGERMSAGGVGCYSIG